MGDIVKLYDIIVEHFRVAILTPILTNAVKCQPFPKAN
jgi:hypothetical protein